MQEEIEITLQPLVGEPLSDMWRYAGHQKFEFGVQRAYKNRKGQDITRADWGLLVACDWRITGREGTIVSSADFGPDMRRSDEKACPFYDMLRDAPPIVEAIEAEANGRLRISMTGGYLLEVLPDDDPDDEHWRFMPKDEQKPHFVIVGAGIEK